MSLSLHIRPYEPRDAESARRLILGIQQDEFNIPITLADQPDLLDIPGFYRQGVGDFWVAAAEDNVIGTIALIDIGGRIGVIRKMFVARAQRGKELGIAQRLLEMLLRHARQAGFAHIYLGTIGVYHAARRFYARNGFTEINPKDLPPTFPRMAVDTHFYRYDFLSD